ncbi:MAG: tyrosine-type recombinase/integrase [Alphaproteobacteria bacterium]|nr:tyrosine-type recombinase/integrase [Alphaproteobacteria bacterium]
MLKVKRPAIQPSRERILSESELAAVYRTAFRASSNFHRLVLTIVHTGARKTETSRLEWSCVGETVIFRPKTTKGKRDHIVPIGPKAQNLFASFPKMANSPYLFPAGREHVRGKKTTVMTGYSDAKRHFDAECGVNNWTLHDIRRTMVSLMCDNLDIAPHIADRIIAHKGNQPSSAAPIYNRAKYLRPMHEALIAWENYLERLLKGYRSPTV